MEKSSEIKVFLDTNILISGIFFKGNEAKLISLSKIKQVTCDICIEELYDVVKRKLNYLDIESLRVALLEISRALKDFEIVRKESAIKYLPTASKLLVHKKDQWILACVMKTKTDYFVTGDSYFHKKDIQSVVRVYHTRELLTEIGAI